MDTKPGDTDAEATGAYAIIAHRLGGELLRHWTLHGGVSARVVALELVYPNERVRCVVVRQHGATNWKRAEPEVTTNEYALLHALADAGLRVPRPLMLDVSGEVLPGGFVVLPFVDSSPQAPAIDIVVERMASLLVQLHAQDVEALDVALLLPRRDDQVQGALEYLPTDFHHVRRVLEDSATERASGDADVVLHGDFWPGNILWREQAIIAVIDWEDAAVGDRLADVAGCRVELLWHHGQAASEGFVEHYARLSGRALDAVRLATWELYVASAGLAYMDRWGLDATVEATMRARAQWCLESAGARLLKSRQHLY